MRQEILKRFLGRIGVLSLPIITLYILLFNLGYLPILSNSVSFDMKEYHLRRIKLKQARIMTIGSSVALFDINSQLIRNRFGSSYYNFGSLSLQMEDDYSLLKRYVVEYHPNYVIFPSSMGDFMLEPNNTLPKNFILMRHFLGYYYIKNFAGLFEMRQRKKAIDSMMADNNRYDCLRFDEGGGVQLNLSKSKLNPQKLNDTLPSFPNEHTESAYMFLENIARYLKTMNVKLIFIQCPYRNRSIHSNQLRTNVNQHFLRCKRILEKYNGLYLNYHGSSKFPDSLFVDAPHLSGFGGKAFTQQIVQDLSKVIQ